MAVVASAAPSMMPIDSAFAPRTVTRNAGSKLWMISDEVSIHSETNPRAMTVLGTKRSPPTARHFGIGFGPGRSYAIVLVRPCLSYRILTSIGETAGVRFRSHAAKL